MSDGGLVTFVGIAHPWACDQMGHLNARHYAAIFDDAGFQLLARVTGAEPEGTRQGWADVRLEIDFAREIVAGTPLEVRSRVERVGTTSLTHVHVLTGTVDGDVRASARTVTVRFDLVARTKSPLSGELAARALALGAA